MNRKVNDSHNWIWLNDKDGAICTKCNYLFNKWAEISYEQIRKSGNYLTCDELIIKKLLE